MRDWTVVDRLPLVKAQTLVIAGEFDEATPATWAPFVDLIAGAESHVFDGASHCTHLEQPETFRSVIATFVNEHDVNEHDLAS